MPDKPGVIFYYQLMLGVEAAPRCKITILHMCPQLTVSTDPDIVPNDGSTLTIYDGIRPEPKVVADGEISWPREKACRINGCKIADGQCLTFENHAIPNLYTVADYNFLAVESDVFPNYGSLADRNVIR